MKNFKLFLSAAALVLMMSSFLMLCVWTIARASLVLSIEYQAGLICYENIHNVAFDKRTVFVIAEGIFLPVKLVMIERSL